MHASNDEMLMRCGCAQRYGQQSQFKRTVLEFIVEEMLETRMGEASNAIACPIARGATPVVTGPSDSALQFLYQQLNFSESEVIDRQQLSLGLQRLGAPCTLLDKARAFYSQSTVNTCGETSWAPSMPGVVG